MNEVNASVREGDAVMLLIFAYLIAAVQLAGVAVNFWSFDPRILLNILDLPARDMFFMGLFLLVQLLGLIGGILVFLRWRLGLTLSILHQLLIAPAVLIAGWNLILLTHDAVSATLFYVGKSSGSGVAFHWSVGTGTIFAQIIREARVGTSYIGVNLFALASMGLLWLAARQMDAAKAEQDYEREMEMRRQRQARRRPPEGMPQQHPQQQRMRPPQQGVRQPPRMPPREF